jgi:hypothetical protein
VSPLAEAAYEILRSRAALPDPRITYKELAAQLRECAEEFEYVNHRSRQLYSALNEVGQECRRLKLPSLPALVVRADTGRPGQAFFEGTCSGVVYRDDQVSAWQREVEAVRLASYPALRGHA